MILAAADEDFKTLASQGRVQGRLVAYDGIAPPPVMAMLRGVANKIRPNRNPAGW